jgi:hypothetical protein
MRVWTAQLEGVKLESPNKIIRMKSWEYSTYRNELHLLTRASIEPGPNDFPHVPLKRCEIRVHMRRPRLLDVDAKYGAVKPLLDILQPPRVFSRLAGSTRHRDEAPGLALIESDTDGEGRESGCVTSFQVTQELGPAVVWISVSEL